MDHGNCLQDHTVSVNRDWMKPDVSNDPRKRKRARAPRDGRETVSRSHHVRNVRGLHGSDFCVGAETAVLEIWTALDDTSLKYWRSNGFSQINNKRKKNIIFMICIGGGTITLWVREIGFGSRSDVSQSSWKNCTERAPGRLASILEHPLLNKDSSRFLDYEWHETDTDRKTVGNKCSGFFSREKKHD